MLPIFCYSTTIAIVGIYVYSYWNNLSAVYTVPKDFIYTYIYSPIKSFVEKVYNAIVTGIQTETNATRKLI
jgi:hypothetical protein